MIFISGCGGCYKVWFPPFLPFEGCGEGSALQGDSGSPCHRARHYAGTVRGRVAALAAQATELAQIQLRCHCKATALNRVQNCSAVSCLSWQHLIRTLLSEVPHSSQYNRDTTTDKWTAATSKEDTEKMRRKQLGSPSAKWAVIAVIFMRSRATNLWRI